MRIEDDTADALRRLAPTLTRVAPERLAAETLRLLCGRYAGRVVREYTDVLGVVLPEILPMQGWQQKNSYHLFDVLEHSIRAMEQIPAEPALRLAALYHDTGKPHCMTVDEKGVGHFYGHPKLSAAMAEQRCLALAAAQRDSGNGRFSGRPSRYSDRLEPKTVRRRLAQFGETRVRQLLMMKKADGVGRGTHAEYIGQYQQLEQQINAMLRSRDCLTVHSLALDGYALMRLGLQGKQIGQMQRYLLEQVLDDPARNTPETLTQLGGAS